MRTLKKIGLTAIAFSLISLVSTSTLAASPWGKKQQARQEEANYLTHKIHKQERKANRDLREGNVLGYFARKNRVANLRNERHAVHKKINHTNRRWEERHGL